MAVDKHAHAGRPNTIKKYNGQPENRFFHYLFFLYLIIEFVRPQSLIPAIGLLRPALIAGVCLAIFSVANLKASWDADKSIRLLLLFFALAAASVLFATNNFWAFQYTQLIFLYVFAAIIPMCLLITTVQKFQTLLLFWVGIHTYLALYCLTHGGKGPGGFLEDENDIALALNVAIPFAYFFAQSSALSKSRRFLIAISGIVMVAAVVATASRGGFVGLAVTAAAAIWFSKQRIRNAILLGAAALVFWVLIPQEYKGEIQSISDTEDNTRLDRIYSWTRGWEMFVDNPVFGVGVGNYPWRVAEYEILSGSNYGQRKMLGGRAAHSLYFTLLPETGSAGTLVVLGLLVGFFRNVRRRSDFQELPESREWQLLDGARRAIQVSMVGFLVTAVFISVLYYPQMWYLIGLGLVFSKIATEYTSSQC